MIFESSEFRRALPIHPDTDVPVMGVCLGVWVSGSQRLILT